MATRKSAAPWKDWGLGGDKIAAKLKGARSRDRSVDTTQFTALRSHIKESRSRLEDLKLESQQALDNYKSQQNIGWAKVISNYGIKQGGRLGSVLQLLGNVQQKIDLERSKAQTQAQEELNKNVANILEDDFKASREKKLELYKARADLEECVQKVQHYRRKMKDGKHNQETKLESSMKELLRARDLFTKLNVEVTRDLVDLEVTSSMKLVKATAVYMAAEAKLLEQGLQDLDTLADPLFQLLGELKGENATDFLTPPANAPQKPLPPVKDVLNNVAALEPRQDGRGRLQEAYIVALNQGSKIASHAGSFRALANLRAQKPVPGVIGGGEDKEVRNKVGVVFGRSLEEIPCRAPMNENIINLPDDLAQPPWVVEELCRILSENGKDVEGLFRVSGSQKQTEILREQIEEGKLNSLDSSHPHDLASLLKLFLRELPEPLIPSGLYFEFVETSIRLQSLPLKDHIPRIDEFLKKLPQRHLVTLERLVALLDSIVCSSRTKMDASNISICLAQCIARPPTGTDQSLDVMVSHAGTTAYFLRTLIDTFHSRPTMFVSPSSSLVSSQQEINGSHSRQASMSEINYDLLTGQPLSHLSTLSPQVRGSARGDADTSGRRSSGDGCSNNSHSQIGDRSSDHSHRGTVESTHDETSSQTSFGGSVGNLDEAAQTISRTSSRPSATGPRHSRAAPESEDCRIAEDKAGLDRSDPESKALSQKDTKEGHRDGAVGSGSAVSQQSTPDKHPDASHNSSPGQSIHNSESASVVLGEGQWQEFPESPQSPRQPPSDTSLRSASSPPREQSYRGTPKHVGVSQIGTDMSPAGHRQLEPLEIPPIMHRSSSLSVPGPQDWHQRAGCHTPPPPQQTRQGSMTSVTTNPFDSPTMSPRSATAERKEPPSPQTTLVAGLNTEGNDPIIGLNGNSSFSTGGLNATIEAERAQSLSPASGAHNFSPSTPHNFSPSTPQNVGTGRHFEDQGPKHAGFDSERHVDEIAETPEAGLAAETVEAAGLRREQHHAESVEKIWLDDSTQRGPEAVGLGGEEDEELDSCQSSVTSEPSTWHPRSGAEEELRH